MKRFRILPAGAIIAAIICAVIICAGPAESSAWEQEPNRAPGSIPRAKPTELAAKVPAADTADRKPGRYAVSVMEKGTILVDTATGQTWMLKPYKETLAWLPVERVAATDRLSELGAKISVKDEIVREVDLTDSTLGDADMEILGRLTSLEQLVLSGCKNLTDAGLVHVRSLTKLKGLALERTSVTDAGLANLKDLTDLAYLSLNWTKTSDTGIKHLAGLSNVAVLYLCETKVGDGSLASLSRMQKLQWLDLRGTQVTDAGLPHLGKLPQLRLLSLYGTQLTDRGMPALTELPSLEVLTLAETQVTDAGLLPLAKLPKLNDLDLGGTKVTPGGAAEFQRLLPSCRLRVAPAPSEIIEIVD